MNLPSHPLDLRASMAAPVPGAPSDLFEALNAAASALQDFSESVGTPDAAKRVNKESESFLHALTAAQTKLREVIRAQPDDAKPRRRRAASARDRLQCVSNRASVVSTHLDGMLAAMPPAAREKSMPASDGH